MKIIKSPHLDILKALRTLGLAVESLATLEGPVLAEVRVDHGSSGSAYFYIGKVNRKLHLCFHPSDREVLPLSQIKGAKLHPYLSNKKVLIRNPK